MTSDPQDRETVGSTLPDGDPDEPRPPLSTFREPPERFELGNELGRGGMGRVVAAADVSLRRGVAIKHVLSSDSHDLIRFEREARITAQLEHPSIVPIYDVGIDAHDRPYYVMRRIDGEPLAKRLDADARTRLALLPRVLSVIDAAAFAHARKIIHRDIKPSNILLGSYGETWLIDWGLARRLDEPEEVGDPIAPETSAPGEQLTIAGHVYGTAAYMAPEQARGEAVDARADVYALGATLFHVLSGKGPFHGVSVAQRIASAVEGEAVPVDKLPAETTPELKAIVGKAMATEPVARYPDARELAKDLRAFLDGQLVGAHRYTRRERIRRFVARHRLALSIAALSTVLLGAFAGIAIRRVIRERDRADDRAITAQLERASVLANTDPSRAVALLDALPMTPTHARRMRDIASSAAAHGVLHAGIEQRATTQGLSLSPDGQLLASGSMTGSVVIYETHTARPHLVAMTGTFATPVFGDNRTLLVPVPDGILKIDAVTHRMTLIARGATTDDLWISAPDRVRYFDRRRRELVEIDLPTDRSRIVTTDVDAVRRSGLVALVVKPSGLHLLVGETLRLLTPVNDQFPSQMALSVSLGRAAAPVGGDIVEWAIEDGRETGRWTMRSRWAEYGPDYLYADDIAAAAIMELHKTRNVEIMKASGVVWRSLTSIGLVIAFDDGRIHLIDRAGARTLNVPYVNSRIVAGREDSATFAVGSRDGTVRWWDLTQVWPKVIPTDNFNPCAWTNDFVFGQSGLADVAAIDRRTGERRTLFVERRPPPRVSCALLPGKLVVGTTESTLIVDLATSTAETLPTVAFMIDMGPRRGVYAIGRDLLELGSVPDHPRHMWTAPTAIRNLSAHYPWLTIELEPHQLIRFDQRTTTAVTVSDDITPETGWLQEIGGDVVYTDQTRLLRWTESGETAVIHEFDTPIRELGYDSDAIVCVLADGDVWVISPDGRLFERASRKLQSIAVGAAGIALTVEGGYAITHWLVSGETTMRLLPGRWAQAVVYDAGVAVHDNKHMLIFDDSVPQDPAALHDWIRHATNAHVDPVTDDLSWDWR